MIETTTITWAMSRANLPKGVWFESDGACWRAVACEPHPVTGEDWLWKPANFKALAKDSPEGKMTDHFPMKNLNRT